MGLRCVTPAVNYRCISSYAVVRFLKVRCQSNFARVGNECVCVYMVEVLLYTRK